jgi:hypothetical protein
LPVDFVYTELTIGDWYYIKVDNYNNYYGDFGLCMRGGRQRTIIYCISSGNWNDPTIWSFTENGSPSITIPMINDDVHISGFYVAVDSDQECNSITITNESTASELQVIDGTLKVDQNIYIINANPENGNSKLLIRDKGAVKVELVD